jgi:catechol 2,3-dioxygenase-like lactoylglutathione lyase family enzyme
MKLNHVHLSVRDLEAAVEWIRHVLQAEPTLVGDRMAFVLLGAFTIFFDRSDKDSPATLGFESADCDSDYKMVVERGAVPLEAPVNRAWGTRSAYLRGPGTITLEIEQNLA